MHIDCHFLLSSSAVKVWPCYHICGYYDILWTMRCRLSKLNEIKWSLWLQNQHFNAQTCSFTFCCFVFVCSTALNYSHRCFFFQFQSENYDSHCLSPPRKTWIRHLNFKWTNNTDGCRSLHLSFPTVNPPFLDKYSRDGEKFDVKNISACNDFSIYWWKFLAIDIRRTKISLHSDTEASIGYNATLVMWMTFGRWIRIIIQKFSENSHYTQAMDF